MQRHQDIQARYEAFAHLGSSKRQLSEYHLQRTFNIMNFLTAIFREYLTSTCLSTSSEVFYNICNVPETYLWSLDLYLDVLFLMDLRLFSCSVICDFRQIILSMGTFGKLLSYVHLVAFIMEGFLYFHIPYKNMYLERS
jgi:hypothetical protein